ncbi:MAG TPA: cytochrome b [Alphaproteobacteria bacterium]|nr:cytochrome b [Alphaproteobacteria bacterium]
MAKTQKHGSPYTSAAISLHWAIGVLMIFNLAFGWMLAADYLKGGGLVGIHKSIGMLVLILAATRLTYRLTHTYPGYVPMPQPLKLAAQVNHYLLYALIFWMPLTGFLMSNAGGRPTVFFGLFTIPPVIGFNPELGKQLFGLHEAGMWAAFVLISLHIGAALFHQFYRKDGTLSRMLPFLPK